MNYSMYSTLSYMYWEMQYLTYSKNLNININNYFVFTSKKYEILVTTGTHQCFLL